MSAELEDYQHLEEGSVFYRDFLLERDEILRHKWFESEKASYDIGFEKALLSTGWSVFRPGWQERRRPEGVNPSN